MPSWKIVKLVKKTYQPQTQEVCRADHQTLNQVHEDYFQQLRNWETNLIIRNTYHWVKDRLSKYINHPSRCGRYIEITEDEYKWLSTVQLGDIVRSKQTTLVELGWNKFGEICKAAYVYRLPNSKRWLFFCVGMDGGLKTAYVTPYYKHRAQYHGSVSYVDVPYIQSLAVE